MLAAVREGARRVVLALGGSASTDGGTGLLRALGVRFLGARGVEVEPGGGSLSAISSVDASGLLDLAGVELVLATDVDNPLLGPTGAAHVFGSQKGADRASVETLDEGLAHLVRVLDEVPSPSRTSPVELAAEPGSGAAGGLGLACGWLGARRVSGADFFLDLLSFERHLRSHAHVITGEGRLDQQSLAGKLPSAVVRRASGTPVHMFVGACELGPGAIEALGVARVMVVGERADRDTRTATGRATDLYVNESMAPTNPFGLCLAQRRGAPIPFVEVTGEEWDRVFAVNVRGAYNITRALAPGMADRGFGRIVFLSSVLAERGGGVFGGVAYSAAKAAQLGFARAPGRELGPRGVTVNSVALGLIDTDITAGKLTGEKEAALLDGVPVGRKGRTSDVADLITFLCRPASGCITGATYDVNGGSHIH